MQTTDTTITEPDDRAEVETAPLRVHSEPPHIPQPPRSVGARVAGTVARLALAVAIVGGMLAMGAVPRIKQNQKLHAMAASHRQEELLVQVVRPHSSAGTSSVTLPGNVQAVEETEINARTTGYLRHRYVDIGSHVHAGQVVADIEAPDLDQQLMRARAETSKSKAGQEQAGADVVELAARVQQAKSDLARTRWNVETAVADLAHSKAKLVQAQGVRDEAVSHLEQARKHLNGRKADLNRARARESLADKTLVRWKEMEAGGVVSGQDLDEKQADYDAAVANVASAQADVESAQADVEAARHAIESAAGDVTAAGADVTAATQKVN